VTNSEKVRKSWSQTMPPSATGGERDHAGQGTGPALTVTNREGKKDDPKSLTGNPRESGKKKHSSGRKKDDFVQRNKKIPLKASTILCYRMGGRNVELIQPADESGVTTWKKKIFRGIGQRSHLLKENFETRRRV